jgi:hypothetical protein
MTTTPKDIAYEALRKALLSLISVADGYKGKRLIALVGLSNATRIREARSALALADKAMEDKI